MNAISLRNMGIAWRPFNTFFLVSLLLAGAVPIRAADPATTNSAAAAKPKPKKASDLLAVVRLYAEVTDDGSGPKAEVIRSRPQTFPINKEPFMDERDLMGAEIVETPDGGFMIKIDGTPHGQNALEMATIAANGRHLVIFGQWTTDSDETEARWLAAPLIRGPLRNGSVVFTADCSREEAQKLVDGLNNVAVKLKNQPKSKGAYTTKGTSKKAPVSSTSTAGELINKNTRQ